MRMTKKILNLLIDKELVKKQDNKILITSYFKNKIREYLIFIEAVSYVKKSMDWAGFEPTASTLRR